MPSCLHVTNGDIARNLLVRSGLGGDVLAWRDTMFEGPFPAGLTLPATSALRAAYLAGTGLPEDRILKDFQRRDETLRKAPAYDAVTLWFEHDLLDQLQFLQILDWFAGAGGHADLGLICIGAFPGIDPFRGLGQLDPQQIASLAPQRQPVTAAHLGLARSGWAAFRAPDPRAVEDFLAGDLSPLPFAGAALLRHLQEFPSVAEGVGRTHRQLLRLVADGVDRPDALFRANSALETVLHMGDWSTFRRLGELCRLPEPLLACAPHGTFRWPPQSDIALPDFRAQVFSLTAKGRRVLAGEAAGTAIRGLDHWLGGVHFANGAAVWRWNAAAGRLQRGS
jgi:hypothetical protein